MTLLDTLNRGTWEGIGPRLDRRVTAGEAYRLFVGLMKDALDDLADLDSNDPAAFKRAASAQEFLSGPGLEYWCEVLPVDVEHLRRRIAQKVGVTSAAPPSQVEVEVGNHLRWLAEEMMGAGAA